MVHALEVIHRLLKRGGSLIDIHPILQAPLVEVHQGGVLAFAEPVPAHDDEDQRAAEDALSRVIQRGLFVDERSALFDFLTYGSSVAELRDFLIESSGFSGSDSARKWEVERVELAKQADRIMRTLGAEAQVAFHERARITRLRPL